MSTKDEIEEYLEGKKLKNVTLSDNVNDYDKGGAAKEEKIGQKNLDQEKTLAWMNYVTERDRKMQFGDRQAIAEYMQEATEIRQRQEEQKERSRLEYDLLQEEKARLAKLSKITQEDRDNEKEDLEKLERKKQKEIDNILEYFNCPEDEWQEYLHDKHTPEQSPANVLIGRTDKGIAYCCGLHRYKDGAFSAFDSSDIEDHFRKYEPEKHRAAIIDTINEKYSKLIEARKEKTLEDKDVAFNKEVRQIESIKTRPGGDAGLFSSTRKITKGDKARIRREEEAENERNKKIYRGLYS